MEYLIKRAPTPPALAGDWDGKIWRAANTLDVSIFRDKSTAHHPQTQAKLLYDDRGVYGIFRVEDKYVRSVQTAYNSSVCGDSCVEFFVKPRADKGYFNFEMNCGGTLLLFYITDHTRTENGFKERTDVPWEIASQMKIYHSMPNVVDPAIEQDTVWLNEFFIPYSLFEHYLGKFGDKTGMTWRANFYKCGDKTPMPHWASWAPITATNFHLPDCFQPLKFV
jgi:hypothetical protein